MRRFLVWSSVLIFIGILIAAFWFRSVQGRFRVVGWTNTWQFNVQEGLASPSREFRFVTLPFVMFQIHWFSGGFHYECYEGYLEEVMESINRGADVNAVDKSGKTAIEYAVRQNHQDIAIALCENGADATVLNMTMLKHIIGMDQVEMMSALVHEGVPIDVNQKYEAESLIDMATRLERKEILEMLEPLAREGTPELQPTGS